MRSNLIYLLGAAISVLGVVVGRPWAAVCIVVAIGSILVGWCLEKPDLQG